MHGKKDIAKVLRHLPAHLTVTATAAGHRWGYIQCTVCGQRISVWSTPRSSTDHAKDLARFATRHQH